MNKFTLGLHFHLLNTPSFIRQSANEAGDLSVQRQLTATELRGLTRAPRGLAVLCVRLFACSHLSICDQYGCDSSHQDRSRCTYQCLGAECCILNSQIFWCGNVHYSNTRQHSLCLYVINFIFLANAEKKILIRISERQRQSLSLLQDTSGFFKILQAGDHRRLLWKRSWTFVLSSTTSKLLEQLTNLKLAKNDRSFVQLFRKCRYMNHVSIAVETADLQSGANVCVKWQLISRDTCYQKKDHCTELITGRRGLISTR